MHTKDKLAEELNKLHLWEMAKAAKDGYYDDYLSQLALPITQLAADLYKVGTDEALALRKRVTEGEFDATPEESEAWAKSPEGKATFAKLVR
jgi:hypothetical protein